MKRHTYIRFMLSLLLIVSNLSVAFSMHLCEGRIERVKLNHLDNQTCKMQKPVSCCAEKEEATNCELPKQAEEDDCCKDIAYQDDLQNQQTVEIVKISPIAFFDYPKFIPEVYKSTNEEFTPRYLDFYVASNAPPIYLTQQQLLFYEA